MTISIPESIGAYDEAHVKKWACRLINGLSADDVKIVTADDEFGHNRPKNLLQVGDDASTAVEVYVNRGEFCARSDSEKSSSSSDSEAGLGDTAEHLQMLVHTGLGKQVGEEEISIKWYKAGSIAVCIELPEMAAVKLKLALKLFGCVLSLV